MERNLPKYLRNITSNRESGEGRYDIQLVPKDMNMPGILMELKADKDCSEEEFKKLSQDALLQIAVRKYETDMYVKGIKNHKIWRCI